MSVRSVLLEEQIRLIQQSQYSVLRGRTLDPRMNCVLDESSLSSRITLRTGRSIRNGNADASQLIGNGNPHGLCGLVRSNSGVFEVYVYTDMAHRLVVKRALHVL